jgi:hypothetical protein
VALKLTTLLLQDPAHGRQSDPFAGRRGVSEFLDVSDSFSRVPFLIDPLAFAMIEFACCRRTLKLDKNKISALAGLTFSTTANSQLL